MKKNLFFFSRGHFSPFSIFFVLVLPIFSSVYAQPRQESPSPQEETPKVVTLLSPQEETEIISKKPLIKCSIQIPFDPQKLLVLFDGTDITALLKVTPEGFEYKPIQVVPPGSHTLSVTLTDREGKEFKQEFKFSSRHSKFFEGAYTKNEISTIEEVLATKTRDVNRGENNTVPSARTEANLANESKLKFKEWEFVFRTNVRHFDQNLRVTEPMEKGFILANYLFQGKYTREKFNILAETGDLTLNETPFTVSSLGRRGGQFQLQYRSDFLFTQLRTFVVKSEQLFGFNGGMGLGTTPKDHIMGISGDLNLFSDKLKFRTIYVRGGDDVLSTGTNPLGVSTIAGPRKGEVLGFVFGTDFFNQKLTTEAEVDFSKYDPDTSDEFLAKRDKAFKLKIGGIWNQFTYEGVYQHIGRDYEVIGNQGLQKDWEGFTLKTGADFKIHSLNLTLSRYHDNVKRDDLYPRVYSYCGKIEYSFKKFESLPITLSYEKSRLDSEHEPPDLLTTKTDTDTVTGSINFIKEPWGLGASVTYSLQNDHTHPDNDTSTVTYSFSPRYTLDWISISSTLSFNRSRDHLAMVHTDTYTANLDITGDILKEKLTYEVAGTYTRLRASDLSSKQDNINGNFKLAYILGKNLWGFLNPSVGIRGLYNRTDDGVLHQTTNEFALFFFLSASMLISF